MRQKRALKILKENYDNICQWEMKKVDCSSLDIEITVISELRICQTCQKLSWPTLTNSTSQKSNINS
jgi:hypothetical protein